MKHERQLYMPFNHPTTRSNMVIPRTHCCTADVLRLHEEVLKPRASNGVVETAGKGSSPDPAGWLRLRVAKQASTFWPLFPWSDPLSWSDIVGAWIVFDDDCRLGLRA